MNNKANNDWEHDFELKLYDFDLKFHYLLFEDELSKTNGLLL